MNMRVGNATKLSMTRFSKDFVNFMRGLRKNIFRYKITTTRDVLGREHTYISTKPTEMPWKTKNLYVRRNARKSAQTTKPSKIGTELQKITRDFDKNIFSQYEDSLKSDSEDKQSELEKETSYEIEGSTELRSTRIPAEFDKFLHGLGLMVYKYRMKPPHHGDSPYYHDQYFHSSTFKTPTKISRRNNKNYRLQKEALKDVLMMKLVSYYEDKYQITPQEMKDTDSKNTTKIPIIDENFLYTTEQSVEPDSSVDPEETILNDNYVFENITTVELPTLNNRNNVRRSKGNEDITVMTDDDKKDTMQVEPLKTTIRDNVAEVVVI